MLPLNFCLSKKAPPTFKLFPKHSVYILLCFDEMDFMLLHRHRASLGEGAGKALGSIRSSFWVRRQLYWWEGSFQGKDDLKAQKARQDVGPGSPDAEHLTVCASVPLSPSGLTWGYGFCWSSDTAWGGRCAVTHSLQPPDSKHEWVSGTAVGISESPSPPSRAPEWREMLT